MQDQIVSFEVAKLAKEKGFKEYCENLYNEEGIKFPDLGNYNQVDDDKYISYSAPTQSILQKWLREVHNTNIHIGYIFSSKLWDYTIYSLSITAKEFMNNHNATNMNERYLTYEEALEAGLFKALISIKES